MGNENDIPSSELETPEPVNPTETEGAADNAEPAAVTDAGTLQAEIETLKAQLDEAKDQSLRAAAEVQNTRHRAQQDVEKAHKYALEKFVGDLLPVADNLERALAAMDKTAEGVAPVVEGVELTLKTLVDALGRHQVEAIDPAGQPFDPQLHQAMTMVANPDLEPNTVMDVFQKGYQLNGRLVRPAMVVVSKAAD